jgi:beta-glucosidase
MGGALGSDEGEVVGMDMVGFMLDMPLLSVLHFQESLLSVTPEQQVDQLLEQVAGLEL